MRLNDIEKRILRGHWNGIDAFLRSSPQREWSPDRLDKLSDLIFSALSHDSGKREDIARGVVIGFLCSKFGLTPAQTAYIANKVENVGDDRSYNIAETLQVLSGCDPVVVQHRASERVANFTAPRRGLAEQVGEQAVTEALVSNATENAATA